MPGQLPPPGANLPKKYTKKTQDWPMAMSLSLSVPNILLNLVDLIKRHERELLNAKVHETYTTHDNKAIGNKDRSH